MNNETESTRELIDYFTTHLLETVAQALEDQAEDLERSAADTPEAAAIFQASAITWRAAAQIVREFKGTAKAAAREPVLDSERKP